MAKKKEKGKGKNAASTPADALREAVERTFAGAAGVSGEAQKRAQDLFDDVTATLTRLREAIEERRVLETLDHLREQVEGLARRVAQLERSGDGKPAETSATEAKETSAPTTGGGTRKPASGRTSTRKPATSRAKSSSTGTRSSSGTTTRRSASNRSASGTTRSRSTTGRGSSGAGGSSRSTGGAGSAPAGGTASTGDSSSTGVGSGTTDTSSSGGSGSGSGSSSGSGAGSGSGSGSSSTST